MLLRKKKSRARSATIAVAAGGALSLILAGCNAGGSGNADGDVELTFLVNTADDVPAALLEAFGEANPNITVRTTYQPGGAEGSNLIKTKLATGEMEDVFFYVTGSLLQALRPDETLTDLSEEAWAADLDDAFVAAASTDNGMYGAPMGTSQGGVVLYNIPVYEELGLEVPTSWEEFAANNEAILASGVADPVIQTYDATWSSQLWVLGDFGNVAAQDPDWAEGYTNNERKMAEQPALQAWLNQQEAFEAGWFNEDYGSATLDDGLRMLALGEGVHYPLLTSPISTVEQNYPENVGDIGGFALPAQDAEDTTLTVWPPSTWYIPKTTEGAELEAAKAFLAFINSSEGCALQNEFGVASGPYVISSCELPDDVAPLLLDMQAYYDANKTSPALEFISPVKGPNLELITVEVGSGILSGEEGAALYDEDVKKQAQQLGLDGW